MDDGPLLRVQIHFVIEEAMTMDGQIHAWQVGTRKPVRLRWAEGRVTHLETVSSPPEEEQWIAPGLFDLQVNGYGGVDFQQDDLALEDLLTAARGLRSAGCPRF